MQIRIAFLFISLIILVAAITEPVTKVQLGEKLFHDPILSRDSTLSCASCHKPQFAFADTVAITPGIEGRIGRRNAPSIMNMAFRSNFFFDGRAATLRDQVHFPIEDPMEMDLEYSIAIERINNHPYYKDAFLKIYGEAPNADNIADAIASFEESLETSDTEFDAWMADKENTMTEAAIRGKDIFISDRAKCFDCHFGPDFTADEFRNIGLYDGISYKDAGRYEVTKNPADLGKFKVPGLRNVAITAPYMHDGSFKTLRDVIDYYSNPYEFVANPINIDTLLARPLNLSEQEKQDLEAFLLSLTDKRFIPKS
ncbi:MAG: cytochrome-c peroxidase [Saprospiraceae bacterium]|nr:MAG: hypothetical protein UZ09_BCD002001002 [Bacteroidetes bacterium OLB9]MCO6462679.1 cytochrome-c peroxidase [Saprospiraceae bacterium]